MVGAQRRPEKEDPEGDSVARPPVLGQVVNVFVRDTTDPASSSDVSNHEANVILFTGKEEPRRFPIIQDYSGTAAVPKVGDIVFIEYMRGVTERPVITGYAYTRNDVRPPLAREGHWRREFKDLYVEAERTDHAKINPGTDDYDVIRLAKKSDGLSDPSTQVAIDDSGGTTEIKVETDGDITLSAGGDIVIDEGGTTQSVAIQNHTHDYDDDDGTGTTTKTTTTPNESGTKTQIE